MQVIPLNIDGCNATGQDPLWNSKTRPFIETGESPIDGARLGFGGDAGTLAADNVVERFGS